MATKKSAKKATKKPVKKVMAKKPAPKKAAVKAKPVAKKAVKKSAPKKTIVKKVVAKKAVKSVKAVSKKTNAKVAAKKVTTKPNVQKSAPVVKTQKLQPTKNVDYSKAITPLADRLVVRVIEGERVTAGGLIIPHSVSQAVGFLKASVLAVGNGATNKKGLLRPLDVKVGDTVLFAEHAGTKVQFNAEELQIIHESDVMGITQY